MKENKVALIIMPRSSSAWPGAQALWITAAGWAAAAERRFGSSWVLTNDRTASPAEALNYPIIKKEATSVKKKGIQFIYSNYPDYSN